MKNLLLIFTLLIFILFSCKKEDVSLKPTINGIGRVPLNTMISYGNYHQVIFDSCINDSVTLNGLETYKLTQYMSSSIYYIRYEIDLTGVTGISKTDSIKFTGGGKNVDMTRAIDDSSRDITTARINMRIVFKSDSGDKIIFRELARAEIINNVQVLYFDTGYVESCK